MKYLITFCACLFLLGGCGSAARDESGVQEIKPGEQSVIQPPATTQPAKGGLEEKNI